MFHIINKVQIVLTGMILMSFPSCTGILGGLYDQPKKLDTGFVSVSGNTGLVALDVQEYDEWHYIDFSEQKIYTRKIAYPVGSTEEGEDYSIPENWDIAIHRHDVKTNGGAVLETASENFADLEALASAPEGEYVTDIPPCSMEDLNKEGTEGRVEVDMSGMMDGNIGYVPSSLNLGIENWVIVYGGMPPSFKYSPNVYLVRMPDGTCFGLKIQEYTTKIIDVVTDGKTERASRKVLAFQYCYPMIFKNDSNE